MQLQQQEERPCKVSSSASAAATGTAAFSSESRCRKPVPKDSVTSKISRELQTRSFRKEHKKRQAKTPHRSATMTPWPKGVHTSLCAESLLRFAQKVCKSRSRDGRRASSLCSDHFKVSSRRAKKLTENTLDVPQVGHDAKRLERNQT